jgi:hypothetical protein
MQKSLDNDFIAIVVGHMFVRGDYALFQLFIFKEVEGQGWVLKI